MRLRTLVVIVLLAGGVATACSGGGESASTTSGPPGDPTLGPDLQRVSGPVTGGSFTAVADADVPMPVTLTVAARGGGNGAVISGTTVDGTAADIVWDGGRPLTLEGDGALSLATDSFRVADGHVVASLGASAHVLRGGQYRLLGPVAVGDSSGLARPSDATNFRVDEAASLTGTGLAEAQLPTVELAFLGPGTLALDGDFVTETATASDRTTTIRLDGATFELVLRPAADGALGLEVLMPRA